MTRRDSLQCIHEPFGDAFYFGPERLSRRYEDDEEARLASGFSTSTFKTIFDRIESEATEVCQSCVICPFHACRAVLGPDLHILHNRISPRGRFSADFRRSESIIYSLTLTRENGSLSKTSFTIWSLQTENQPVSLPPYSR